MGNTHLKALYQSIGTVFHYLMFYGIQEFGVIRFTFEFSTLKKGHTEQWRTQRFYIVAIVSHGGTVGAMELRRLYVSIISVFVYFTTKSWVDIVI